MALRFCKDKFGAGFELFCRFLHCRGSLGTLLLRYSPQVVGRNSVEENGEVANFGRKERRPALGGGARRLACIVRGLGGRGRARSAKGRPGSLRDRTANS